ncbi:hypothetical protein COY95_03920, partial [Candidatus Woesearchaeota archaeon CG_4_10_14_0_8_um_filter_47_5]
EKDKMQIIKGYHSIHLPHKFYKEAEQFITIPRTTVEDIKLDDKDLKILKILAEDARTPSHTIAKHVGLTGEAVTYRIKKLHKANVIRKFSILVNLSALDFHWYTTVFQVKTFNPHLEARFDTFVSQHPYILRAVKTLGKWDFMLTIVADSPKHFHKTIKEIKSTFSEILLNHQTYMGYREFMYNPLPDEVKIG